MNYHYDYILEFKLVLLIAIYGFVWGKEVVGSNLWTDGKMHDVSSFFWLPKIPDLTGLVFWNVLVN